ncbi:histidine phosphatase family protein [Microbacterium amylolyticum]|uniref:Broad specificity phosphatase PhoE n=1 Tax=Microbacterium amylolyticum TaxID=936337 RepID=A0ABS4ZF34_9MICO|nr:histidine phosphatase family protein [Microbacterium amylolyticum]MBP2435827.1 broad specificity phosphatase PhoE [Microbacterium amylolyticum]
MTVIALLRHGQTEWNRARRVQGRSDIPLNETGRAQAAAAAEALRGGEYTRITASPLLRAKETAEIIGQSLGLGEPALFDGLMERCYGEAEGMDVSTYWETYAGGKVVPGAETDDEVLARAVQTLIDIAAGGPEDEHVIAVAHGGLIRRVLEHASDGRYPLPNERIENGSQQIIEVTGSEFRVLSYVGV